MGIRRDMTVKLTDDKSSLDKKLILYERDRGLDIYFKIVDCAYVFNENQNILEDLNSGYFSITIVDPKGIEIFRDNLPITENKCKLTITEDLTEEMVDVGIYQLQIHITDTDANDDNQFSIPPFTFEVRERLKGATAIINKSTINNAIIASEQQIASLDYNETVWKPGDLITDVKMNKLEDGVKDANTPIDNSKIDDWFN